MNTRKILDSANMDSGQTFKNTLINHLFTMLRFYCVKFSQASDFFEETYAAG